MNQRSSIYWKNQETGRRARWMADAEGLSVSQFVSSLINGQFVSSLINERYDRLYPEPPITAHCSICDQENEFVFMAYWAEQSNLYQCTECGKVRQYSDLMNDGHHQMADEKAEKEAIR